MAGCGGPLAAAGAKPLMRTPPQPTLGSDAMSGGEPDDRFAEVERAVREAAARPPEQRGRKRRGKGRPKRGRR